MKKTTKLLWLIALLMTTVVSAYADQIEKPVPADCQLESGTSYYLYLPAQDKCLLAEGLEPTMASEGSLITIEKADNNEWTMKSPNGYLYVGFDFVGCDASELDFGCYWYVEKQASGSYRLRSSKDNPNLSWDEFPDMWMGLSTETWMIAPVLKAEEGFIDWYPIAEADYPAFKSKNSLYKLIVELQGYGYDASNLITVYNTANDKEAFDAAIASVAEVIDRLRFENASDEHPYDATPLYMTNAALNPTDGKVLGWSMQSEFLSPKEYEKKSFYDDNNTLESGWNSSIGDNRLSQQLTGLRNGKYRLGNYGMWVRTDESDGESGKGVYLYAKVGSKTYKQEVSGYGWYEALSQMEFECRNGEAEVGIMFEASNVGYCRVFDFRLEYLGDMSAADRLTRLISLSQPLVEEKTINKIYLDRLSADIQQAAALIESADAEAQEKLFETFNKDYEDALNNRDAYVVLQGLIADANAALIKGESKEMGELADYLMEGEIEEGADNYSYDNAQIHEIINTLRVLVEKAANSVIAPGTDVTDLLVNGRFDTSGGWTATMGDFGIDPNKKIMEKWWGDWAAEQTLTNVPNGTYRLEIQGFKWCSWDWAQSESDWLAGDQTPTYGVTSKIRLNNDEATIQNVWACGPTDIKEGYQGANYFVPDNADRAKLFFDLGLYENMVETTVTDNTLKVTIDCSNSGFWNCFTNLRLTYVGVDLQAAKATLSGLIEKAEENLLYTMAGSVRKAIEDAKTEAETLVESSEADYEQLNTAILKIQKLFREAAVSIKDYEHLAATLKMANDVLEDESIAATEAGKSLQALYQTTKTNYDSVYPTFDSEGVAAVISQLEELISKAKQGAGFNAGDDITRLIANASFENTIGQDGENISGVHSLPYGWSMNVSGKECYSAQDIYDAGINSWTAIEENKFTTDGQYSYCLLSAPTPDNYLYQSIKGLPAGTYRVTVDMNVPTDGSSRLTGQRLLVNNVAQYYGKAEQYDEAKLSELHPEETSRTFAGYDELNANTSGEAGDMLIEHTLSVEVFVAEGETLTLGVRTDGNYDAMTIDYGEVGWDCRGRYKIDNFRLYCVSLGVPAGIELVENKKLNGETVIFDLQGRRLDQSQMKKGLYIVNGKKVIK